MNFKAILSAIGLAVLAVTLAACSAADTASRNLSTAADNFEVNRRVIFYNGITDSYMLTIEGHCSLGNSDKSGQLTVTCRVGQNTYKKHFLGLSDNVTYFVEHLEPTGASEFHYRVMFRPQTVLPDIDFEGDASELFGGADDVYEQ
jgi:hypothetical protein